MMNKIRFSHSYPKLHGQTTARLIDVELTNRAALDEKFVDYDTTYEDCYPTDFKKFPLSNDLLLVLTFSGNLRIPFTTIRRATGMKQNWYQSKIGQQFEIVIEPEEPRAQIELPIELPLSGGGINA